MTRGELEWRLIYAAVVAGKSAAFANAAVARLRTYGVPPEHRETPIEFLGREPELHLRAAGTGRYQTLSRMLRELRADPPDLARCAPEDLERYAGVGPKTSRFFILWTRPDANFAVLDRHVLRWLSERGYSGIPRSNPVRGVYRRIEGFFLREAAKWNLTPRELDLRIWGKAARVPNVLEGYDDRG